MPHVTFDQEQANLASGDYSSAGTGSVVRSERIEVTKLSFKEGSGAEPHAHPEEQMMYVLSGRLKVTCGDETYEVGPGEATLNPSNVVHGVMALENTTVLSLKNRVAPVSEPAA
jgi:quercetin dioxygenase-like cupin family protein